MSLDAMLVSLAVASVFVAFAGVLVWGDFQTRPYRLHTRTQQRQHRNS